MFSSPGSPVPILANYVAPQHPPNAYTQLRDILTGNPTHETRFAPPSFAASPAPPNLWRIPQLFHQPPEPSRQDRPSFHQSSNTATRPEDNAGREHSRSGRRSGRKRERSPAHVPERQDLPKSLSIKEPEFDSIVVDTNVMILALAELSNLKNFEYFGLIIPFTVINELDMMKMQNKDPLLRVKAQIAISYLHEQTSSQISWVHLQTRQEVYNVSHGGTPFNYQPNSDDRILDCAIYAQHSGKRVVLLTEDKNLALKSRGNSLKTLSVAELLAHIPSLSLWQEEKELLFQKKRKLYETVLPNNSSSSTPAVLVLVPEQVSSSNGEQVSQESQKLEIMNEALKFLAPRDLLGAQVVCKSFDKGVRQVDWTAKLRAWSGDSQGTMIPSSPIDAKIWYIKWRRTIAARQQ